MRTPWPDPFPPVVVHSYWTYGNPKPGVRSLKEHPLYDAAKRCGDVDAAVALVNDLVSDDSLNRIVDQFVGPEPMIVSPSLSADQADNAIPIAFAEVLAHELDLEILETVHQAARVNRSGAGGWARLRLLPEFEGDVPHGREFIVVDDVLTMGGTLANLRGFIEINGGTVIGTSVLAHKTGFDVNIAIRNHTRYLLDQKFGDDLDHLLNKERGYGTDCLTDQEGRLLLGAKSVDAARKAIAGG